VVSLDGVDGGGQIRGQSYMGMILGRCGHIDRSFTGGRALHRLTNPIDDDGVPPVLGVQTAHHLLPRGREDGVGKDR
jgi:hypothetical protein